MRVQTRIQTQVQTRGYNPVAVAGVFGESSELRAAHALVVYEGNDEALATVHDIIHVKGVGMQLQAGKLLTTASYSSLLQSMVNSSLRRQLAPENVLYADGSALMWYQPSQRRPIFFRTRDQDFQRAVSSKDVWHPTLLFVALTGRLSVYALDSSERPKANTKVYYAPYYNFYPSGSMCQGNSPYPGSLVPSSIPDWEKCFYETFFTHSNYGTVKYVNHAEGHHGLWREMAKAKCPGFNIAALVPNEMTVEGVLNYDGDN